MKKLNYLLAMLALCVLWGCSEDDSTTLSVGQNTLTFPYQGGNQSLNIHSDGQWGISQLPEWLSISAVSGIGSSEVVFTAAANPDYEDRQCQVILYTTDGYYKQMLSIHQSGTHTSEISVNSKEEIIFGGRTTTHYGDYTLELIENYVVVTCDTEWEIEKPSWMTVHFSGKTVDRGEKTIFVGSGNLYMMMNEANNSADARKSVISLKTVSGESNISIPISQLGKDEVFGYKLLKASNGFAHHYKVGANVEYIMALIVEGNIQSSSLTYQDMNHGSLIAACQDGEYTPLLLMNVNFLPDKDYTLFVIGGDANYTYAPLSKVSKYTIHSLTEIELRPRVEIKDVKYEDGQWHWTVKPNDFTKIYATWIMDKQILYSQGLGLDYLSLYLSWGFHTVPGYYMTSDSEKTFSVEDDSNSDAVIVAIPFGFNITPSVAEFYVSDIFSQNS